MAQIFFTSPPRAILIINGARFLSERAGVQPGTWGSGGGSFSLLRAVHYYYLAFGRAADLINSPWGEVRDAYSFALAAYKYKSKFN
jgi:hypothetical protein